MKRPAVGFSMMAQSIEQNAEKGSDGLAEVPNLVDEYLSTISNLASYAKHFINVKNNNTSEASEKIHLFEAAITVRQVDG